MDSAWLKQYQDSLASERYICDLAREQAAGEAERADKAEAVLSQTNDEKGYWQRAAMVTWGILAVLAGGAIFSKIKGII